VDEETMRPVGDFTWLGSVLFVVFSALTLLVGGQEGQGANGLKRNRCDNDTIKYIFLHPEADG